MIYSHHVNMNDVSCNEKNHFSLKYYMLAMGLFCASEMKKKSCFMAYRVCFKHYRYNIAAFDYFMEVSVFSPLKFHTSMY